MTIDEAITVLSECRKLIPGPGQLADAAAAEYLIRRLRGEDTDGTMIVIGQSGSSNQPERRHGLMSSFEHRSQPVHDGQW